MLMHFQTKLINIIYIYIVQSKTTVQNIKYSMNANKKYIFIDLNINSII